MLDMKRSFIYLFILLLVGTAGTAFAQNGEIYGTVIDETSAPFGGVRVEVRQGGIMKGGAATEDDGSFSVKPLQPGTYDVEFSIQSYGTRRITGVVVSVGSGTKLDVVKMSNDPNVLKAVEVVGFKKKLINKTDEITDEQIQRAPTRNLNDLVSLNPGVYQNSRGGGLSIGGARADGTVYVLDGQIVSGTVGGITPAQGTVSQVQVISSGIPANYGDATGGIVAITSKGVTNKLHGAIQGQHSVDGYNQNLLNASATGPLISRMKDGIKEPILGFLAGVDFQYDADDAPTYNKNPVLKGDKLKQLQENPLTAINTTSGTILMPSSRFVTKDDFNYNKRQINNSSTTVRFNGKLDYAVNKNINITAGGSFSYVDAQGYSRVNSYFAPEAIPNQINTNARGYLRFRQSFGNNVARQPDENGKDTSKRPVISNAYYTVQVDYQVTNGRTENPNFKRNLFEYGYVGRFTQNRVPFYAYGVDSLSGRKGVILQTLDGVNGVTFQASDKNPTLANYTRTVFDYFGNSRVGQYSDVQGLGGMLNGEFPQEALSVNNVRIANIGVGQTGYNYSTSNRVGLHADASFDLKPRNSKTVHAIQFGLYYEQNSSSFYSAFINTRDAGPNSLWNLMNQLVNRHILGLDYNNPIFIHDGKQYTKAQVDAGSFFLPTDTVIYNRINTGNQATFDANLRKKLGAGAFDYIDMYNVDPSKLSLDMFSADEILNQGAGFVSYQGYDYTGKKLTGQVNFNDFFTAKDANGNYTRPLGAFHPNYIAGYIMDQFRFKDMNFNVGVRVERYDASTKVLKDPYSLYEMNTKSGTDGAFNIFNGGKHPDNIGSDYAVYVDNNLSPAPKVVGYRSGDKWYDARGIQIADPAILKRTIEEGGTGGTDPVPYLTTAGNVNISDAKFDPNKSFTDYKPQVNVMPRFQFDFPVNGDKALFYAHYDILVQRPRVGNYATPLDYMYLDRNTGGIIGNPDLKPEKTFDYELGFQQVLTKNSALKIYAFYKERKDMIQVRPYLYAWPRTYYTYGNRDFSTTKGFAFKYDYRKPQKAKIPIEMTLSYTLQFAEGTGSDANSGNAGSGTQVQASGLLQNFISSGLPNLRFVSALNYDSRHNVGLNFNYSYDEHEGPSINGKHPLQNFNANLLMRARSGEPYTTYANVIGNNIQGGLNGTRLPWHFGIDLRLDKSFALKGRTKKGEGLQGQNEGDKSRYFITAFAYFQNIFNIREVLNVYPYTSRPDDDGYITSPTGQQFLNAQQGPMQSAYDLYTLYVNNPNNLAGPRRAIIGASFIF